MTSSVASPSVFNIAALTTSAPRDKLAMAQEQVRNASRPREHVLFNAVPKTLTVGAVANSSASQGNVATAAPRLVRQVPSRRVNVLMVRPKPKSVHLMAPNGVLVIVVPNKPVREELHKPVNVATAKMGHRRALRTVRNGKIASVVGPQRLVLPAPPRLARVLTAKAVHRHVLLMAPSGKNVSVVGPQRPVPPAQHKRVSAQMATTAHKHAPPMGAHGDSVLAMVVRATSVLLVGHRLVSVQMVTKAHKPATVMEKPGDNVLVRGRPIQRVRRVNNNNVVAQQEGQGHSFATVVRGEPAIVRGQPIPKHARQKGRQNPAPVQTVRRARSSVQGVSGPLVIVKQVAVLAKVVAVQRKHMRPLVCPPSSSGVSSSSGFPSDSVASKSLFLLPPR